MGKKSLWRSVKGRAKILLGREHGILYSVASPARSGTMWYSQLRTAGPSFCFHELTTHLLLYPSNLGMDEWFAEMHTPANARTNRDRTFSPEEIWSGWGADQRRTFRRICGKSMRVLGYPLPKP